jgi:phosphoribosyl-ATP pyrophosphohydrolase/phosphoribosyl-AMP cyclohydrolase
MARLDYKKGDGLVPVIVQDARTLKVLMLGYMNDEALQVTQESGKVTFWSRSKNRLWTKGETSGNYLQVKSIKEDCDKDTLLIQVVPSGPVCHTGSDTCFQETNNAASVHFLQELFDIISDRYNNPSEGSYTNSLFKEGINKIAQKVGEEAVELVIEAKDDNADLFNNEAADLLFHFLVLLKAKGVEPTDVIKVLKERHK